MSHKQCYEKRAVVEAEIARLRSELERERSSQAVMRELVSDIAERIKKLEGELERERAASAAIRKMIDDMPGWIAGEPAEGFYSRLVEWHGQLEKAWKEARG